jgi:hypothetical protein
MPLSRINTNSIANNSINASDLLDASITAAKIISVANTQITGNIVSSQITSVGGSQITANTVANSAFQTGSIENYVASTGRPLTNRNIIINGAMQIAQRNTSVTGITTGNYYTADRWQFSPGSLGTWTMNVESSAPTSTEFRKSANCIVTTADSSPAASDFCFFQQIIEGQNVQLIKKGTAAAESITVSFWVKTSNTGTYITELNDNDNARSVSKSFTINSIDTWEKKTLVFPPDTTGAFDNDNADSLYLNFWLGAGTDYTSGTLSTIWATRTSANRAVGQLNIANRVGNYFAITGVQLETGTVATPFEIRHYGTELVLCQRYYQRSYDLGVATGTVVAGSVSGTWQYNQPSFFIGTGNYGMNCGTPFPVIMRAIPTITVYSPSSGTAGSVTPWNGSDYTLISSGGFVNASTSRITGGGYNNATTSGLVYGFQWTASAEL